MRKFHPLATCVFGLQLSFICPAQVAITEYAIGTLYTYQPRGITAGPDGNLWFTEAGARMIGSINPITGGITQFPFCTNACLWNPFAIVTGPDGNLWFSQAYGKVGNVTTTGVFTEFQLPPPPSNGPPT
jgi:virginiamycin B lyase